MLVGNGRSIYFKMPLIPPYTLHLLSIRSIGYNKRIGRVFVVSSIQTCICVTTLLMCLLMIVNVIPAYSCKQQLCHVYSIYIVQEVIAPVMAGSSSSLHYVPTIQIFLPFMWPSLLRGSLSSLLQSSLCAVLSHVTPSEERNSKSVCVDTFVCLC